MSILTILIALLLSGSSGFPAQTNVVSGGGPTSSPSAAGANTNLPAVDVVSGGGPISGQSAAGANTSPPAVDVVIGGGPTS